ncbi:hypothetical protein SS50377_21255 [Spironucleus salmonicida]|uniref:Uncharacterized protein n=1 Tax=Spironucleus salmonicida TaxID=348837 RepID=V6LJX4_9EUKA|nr:hypothetical protein SS50377_21255 [Spironucleus salmonicida]|eukprot:EST44026.1 Hypothetical protein SS50377_16335 [Spironucleus salmonicida]
MLDICEKANIAINKSQYTYKDQKYQDTINSLQNAHHILEIYFKFLPNYAQYQYKTHFTVIVSDIYAQQALCELFQQKFDLAQNKLQKSLYLIPDKQLYFIKAAIFAGLNEPENLLLALTEGNNLINRSFLDNYMKISNSVLLALKLFISSKTNNQQRTYSLLSALLNQPILENIEYLAIVESMRAACEQFHQIPVALQVNQQLNIPGLQGNLIFDFQKIQFWAFNQFKFRQGDITLPGTQMTMYEIFLFYIPQLGDFKVAQIQQYLQPNVFQKTIWKSLAKMSRIFMGMVKLSKVKDIKSDQKMLIEQDFRNYIFDQFQGQPSQGSLIQSSSFKDSQVSMRSQLNRHEQDIAKKRQEFIQPIQIFDQKFELDNKQLFQSSQNIKALSSRNSNLLKSQSVERLKNKPVINFGNGKCRTDTRLINNTSQTIRSKNIVNLKQDSVNCINKYDYVKSKYTQFFQDIQKNESKVSTKFVEEDSETSRANENQICFACDRVVLATVKESNIQNLNNMLQQQQGVRQQIIQFELKCKKDNEIAKSRKEKCIIDHQKINKEAVKYERTRDLELQLNDDDLLQTYKEKLNNSRLLLTNFDDYQKVLYINDKVRPQYQNDDPDFTDLFQNIEPTNISLSKKFQFSISTKSLENLNLDELNQPPLNQRYVDNQDQKIGEQLLSKFKSFEKFQFTKFDRPSGKYMPIRNDTEPESCKQIKIESSILKQKLDEIAKLNSMRYQKDMELQKEIQKTGKVKKPFKYLTEDIKDCDLQKYFRTNRSSFIFNIK